MLWWTGLTATKPGGKSVSYGHKSTMSYKSEDREES